MIHTEKFLRRFLHGLFLVLALTTGTVHAATDWPMLLGSQSLSGNVDGIAPEVFTLAWSRDFPARIYQVMPSGQGILCGLADGTLVRLDTAGETVWSRTLPAPVIRMPLLWRDLVFVLSGRDILCLSCADGRLLWSRSGSAAHQFSVPALGDGILYSADRTGVLARVATNGRVLWKNETVMAWGAATVRIENSLLVQHRDYRSPGGSLVCLDTLTGTTRWQRPIDRDANIFPPLVNGDRVLQAAASSLQLFDLKTGTLLGHRTFATPLAGHPLVMDGMILVPLTDGHIVRLEPETLVTTASYSHHRERGNRLAAAARRLYLAGDDNVLRELDAGSGATLRRLQLPGATVTHIQPVLSGGLLYAATGQTLHCVGLLSTRTNRDSLPRTDRPALLLRVFDEETRQPLDGPLQLSWLDPDGEWHTDEGQLADGALSLPPSIPTGRRLSLEKKEYGFTNTFWPDGQAVHTVFLRRLRQEERLILRNILFDVGSTGLLPASQSVLAGLVRFLKLNPGRRLVVEGHTDATGDAAENRTLSLRRAEVIREYLVLSGIGGWRIRVAGFGADRPVGDNATESGRRDNRRTEMRILE